MSIKEEFLKNKDKIITALRRINKEYKKDMENVQRIMPKPEIPFGKVIIKDKKTSWRDFEKV